jgi:Peptidase family C25/Propeptide_C25
MKTNLTLTIVLFIFLTAQAVNIDYNPNHFSIQGSFEILKLETKQFKSQSFVSLEVADCINAPYQDFIIPFYTETVVLPSSGNFKLEHISYDYEEIQLEAKLPSAESEKQATNPENIWIPQQIVSVGKPMIMRGERFVQISCAAVQYNPYQNKIRLIKNLDVTLNIDHSDSRNPLSKQRNSNLFSKITKDIVGSERLETDGCGNYLFIVPQAYETTLVPLLRWKEKLGNKTKIEFMENIGSTEEDLKFYLQSAYDNWQVPPEYVVLVGDADGSISIPTFFVPGGPYSPWDCTDHTYTLLDGDDYFPDIMIGRLSVRELTDLQTIISKIIKYESDPYLGSNWFKSALMMAYINVQSGIYSHRETVLSCGDKLLNFEYAKIDTFIHPFQDNQSQVMSLINSGQSFVNFRGCGDMQQWKPWNGDFTFLNIYNIPSLNNGEMMPMVTSMTCGTGNFASNNYPSCLGEVWLSTGNPGNLKGAIGFIGPSERDTQTEWNNCNDLGIYQGITEENLFRCGEMLLRGKMELFYNYPNNHEYLINNSDHFYFYVYNLLGDPGLQVWTDFPKTLDLAVEEYSFGMNQLLANVTNTENDLEKFIVSITSSDSLIATGYSDASGEVSIPVILQVGNYQVTASKYGYIPETVDLVVGNSDLLGIQNISFLNNAVSGIPLNISFDVHNFSNSLAQNIEMEIISQDEQLAVISSTPSISDLQPGSFSHCTSSVQIAETWNNAVTFDLIVVINSNFGENISLLPVQIISPEMALANFEVQNANNCLQQNEENIVNISLLNCGNCCSSYLITTLSCLNDKASITVNNSHFNPIYINEIGSGSQSFTIIPNNVMSGETARFLLEIEQNSEIVQSLIFEIPIGIIGQASPTFCDYGYYALESQDVGYFDPPQYDWFEIDPDLGGPGSILFADHTISDGFIGTIDLPFEFNYFGNYYSTISICSAGYLCLGETDRIFYRNRNIPSGIGPAAMIAPFWDSLIDGEIYTFYDEENQRFVIEWSDWGSVFDPDQKNTFEVFLIEAEEGRSVNSDIVFQYKEVYNIDSNGNYATIGIENETQTSGLLLTFAGIDNITSHPIENETTIKFALKDDLFFPTCSCETTEISVSASKDTTITQSIFLQYDSDQNDALEFTLSFSHFRSGNDQSREFNRSLENDQILQLSGSYTPVEPINLPFYLMHNSPDGEPIQGVSLDFPDGCSVNFAEDIVDLPWNGETGNGAEISWGFNTGTNINPATVIPFVVNITVAENMPPPLNIDWYIEGDGSGTDPHFASGTISVPLTADDLFWVTYPNGGETILPGIQDTIRWDHFGAADSVKIQLSRDDANNWEMITSEAPNLEYFPYVFDGPLSDQCRIRLCSAENEAFNDISDSLFQIASLNISYPNNSTIMSYANTDSIVWHDIAGMESVKIEITSNNGETWSILEDNVQNTGIYYFTVPGPPSNFYRFRLSNEEFNVENISEIFKIVDSPIDWLTTNIYQGSIPAGENEEIDFSISTADLEFGIYQANILIETELGQLLFIPVSLGYYEDIPPVSKVKLYQNHPNPFNPFTKIEYNLTTESKVKLSVFNVRGQLVKTIVNDIKPAGLNYEYWDGTDKFERPVSSGIYYYLLKAGSKTKAKKMILVK